MRDTEAGMPERMDPFIWRRVVDAAANDRMLVLLSGDFYTAAEAATDPAEKAVLQVLAMATSPMLKPEDWNEPFTPAMSMGGRRSALPTDLDHAQRALLLRIAAAMDDTDDAALRARVFDICWTYLDRSDSSMLQAAIAAYTSVSLEPEVWHGDGQQEWRRAFELVRRRGSTGREQSEAMTSAILDRLRRLNTEDGYFGVDLSEFARAYKLVDRDGRREFGDVAGARAELARAEQAWRPAELWGQEAAAWYSAAGDIDAASHALLQVAKDFTSEAADRRQGIGGDPVTAGHFTDQAVAIAQKLPRTFRADHEVDELIDDLRRQQTADRATILGSMQHITSDPVDLSENAADSRRAVSGRDPVNALIALAGIAPLSDPEQAETTARNDIERHPLQFLFSGETFSASGQRVATTPGMTLGGDVGGAGPIDPTVWALMIRNQGIYHQMLVVGFILPAMQVVTAEHRYSSELLYRICYNSPATPQGHEMLWALGLQRGLDDDFTSAASLLVPQIEHWVRTRLKEHGAHTLVTDERGVETEKGLGSLLDDAATVDTLGAPLVFELKTLLTEQHGPNLRNDIAHGLITDQAMSSTAVVYTWWIALKLVMLPLAQVLETDEGPEDDHASRETDRTEAGPEE